MDSNNIKRKMTNLTHLNLGRKGQYPHHRWDTPPMPPEGHPVPERQKGWKDHQNASWHHYSFIGLLYHLRPHAERERDRDVSLRTVTLTALTVPQSFNSQTRSKVS